MLSLEDMTTETSRINATLHQLQSLQILHSRVRLAQKELRDPEALPAPLEDQVPKVILVTKEITDFQADRVILEALGMVDLREIEETPVLLASKAPLETRDQSDPQALRAYEVNTVNLVPQVTPARKV